MVLFMLMSWKFNVLLSGEGTAKTMGINVEGLRFVSMLVASVITAACVSFLGVIGFVGIICPSCDQETPGTGPPVYHSCVCPCASGCQLGAEAGDDPV